jgi:hypothetical protein
MDALPFSIAQAIEKDETGEIGFSGSVEVTPGVQTRYCLRRPGFA